MKHYNLCLNEISSQDSNFTNTAFRFKGESKNRTKEQLEIDENRI